MGKRLYTKYAAAIHEAMANDANDANEWEGSLVELRENVSLSRQQFDRAWKFLKESGAVVVLRSGNRYGRSRVSLLPFPEKSTDFPLTERRPSGTLEQRVNDLAILMGGVNLLELEARVAQLERKLNNTEGEIT